MNRDEVAIFGCNSRLDTIQAVIGNRLLDDVAPLTERRIAIARRYDEALADLAEYIRPPRRRPGVRQVFHLYVVRARRRDALLAHLHASGVEAKVHYPIPVHLQPAARHLGYKEGDFPVCERDCKSIITLPAHPYLTDAEVEYTIDKVRSFYRRG